MIRWLEGNISAMSRQLEVLEWASLQTPVQPPDGPGQEAAFIDLQGRDSLSVFMELQGRLETLEVSLEVLACNPSGSPRNAQDAGPQSARLAGPLLSAPSGTRSSQGASTCSTE